MRLLKEHKETMKIFCVEGSVGMRLTVLDSSVPTKELGTGSSPVPVWVVEDLSSVLT